MITDAFDRNRSDKIDVKWIEEYSRTLDSNSRNVIVEMLNQWKD